MSSIAGIMSIQEGAKYLEKQYGGSGVLLSGIAGVARGKVMILGAGTVGAGALKIASGMGADVTILDIDLNRLEYIDDVYRGTVNTVYSSPRNIQACIREADLVIGSVLLPGAAAPKLIKREYLKQMKPGSVIVDVAIDQGGCSEVSRVTYHDDPVFLVDGIVNYCVGNMPGAVARTSTLALNNAIIGYGLRIANNGAEKALAADSGLLSGLNVYYGMLCCKPVADAFGYDCADAAGLF
jgi:alanine dehydrogenase